MFPPRERPSEGTYRAADPLPSTRRSSECHPGHTTGKGPSGRFGPISPQEPPIPFTARAGNLESWTGWTTSGRGVRGRPPEVPARARPAPSADSPEWSFPSPWLVPEPPTRPPPLPPPPPGHSGTRTGSPLRWSSPWCCRWSPPPGPSFDRLDINLSRPTVGTAPAPRPGTDPARPGGRFSPRPLPPRRRPGSAPDIDVNAVAAKVQPGMVDIYTQLSSGLSGAGTGMILTPDGEVLTNNHVISGSTSISIEHVATGARYTRRRARDRPQRGHRPPPDPGSHNLPTVPLGRSSTVKVGDPIVALGNAGGVGGAPAHGQRDGPGPQPDDHRHRSRRQPPRRRCPASSRSTPPSSRATPAGPWSTSPARSSASTPPPRPTAASARSATLSASPSPSTGPPRSSPRSKPARPATRSASAIPGQLGVVMSEPAPAADPGGPSPGVTVAEVMPGSPAANAGVVAGDILTEVDGQPATSPEQSRARSRSTGPGRSSISAGSTRRAGAATPP